MVRLKELNAKLNLNYNYRQWRVSHTFGGTTKTKPLYIAGFRRKNFYYVAGITGVVLLIGAVAGGVSFQNSVNSAEDRGQAKGAIGQLVATKATESRTRTWTSDGVIVVTTEITSFDTTIQRGAGTTLIKTTGDDGQITTIPGAITFVTNSDNRLEEKTLIGSTFMVTETGGLTVPKTLYGVPTTFTGTNGDSITSIVYTELTVVTKADGGVSTSFQSSVPVSISGNQPALSTQVDRFTTTETGGAVVTRMTTSVKTVSSSTSGTITSTGNSLSTTTRSSSLFSFSTTITSSSSATISTSPSSPPSSPRSPSISTSSSQSASLTSSAGGGSGALFVGEGTFYAPGLGSCGIDNTEADFVAALSKVLFDATGVANSNNNPYCGRKALVKAGGGKRFLERGAITQVDIIKRVWYTGNITLARNKYWEKTRSQKESRRNRVHSEMESGQKEVQQNLLVQGSSKELVSLPMATQMAMKDASRVIRPPHPIITPPPLSYNEELERRQAGGGGVTITVVDRCPVCAQYDLDLSPAAFDLIGDQTAGRIAIEWSWLD